VTGLPAYLQIATPDDLAFVFAGFRNAVAMTCAWDHFAVDWGDGSSDPDVTSTGGAWPDGTVSHVFEDGADPGYRVAVDEQWACAWRDDLGANGVLTLQTQGAVLVEVRDVQTFVG
jgi:hypothetical protein